MQQELLAFRTQLGNAGAAHGHLVTGNGGLSGLSHFRFQNRSRGRNCLFCVLIGQEITDVNKSGSSQKGYDQHGQKNDHKGIVTGSFLLIFLLFLFFIVFLFFVLILRNIVRIHFIIIKNFFFSGIFREICGSNIGFLHKILLNHIRSQQIRSRVIGAAANGTAFCGIRICGSANITDNFIHTVTSSSNRY